MIRYEDFGAPRTVFQRLDWQLQVALVGWTISVGVLVIGLWLLDANAQMLSMMPK